MERTELLEGKGKRVRRKRREARVSEWKGERKDKEIRRT